jgi:hypothetical protein
MTTFVTVAVLTLAAGDPPAMPTPTKEHAWLNQLAGEWVCEAEAVMEPGKPPIKCKGTESVRSLGGFWTVGELKSEMMGVPMTGVMTLGYDAKLKKYVGTWVCSADGHLWKYEGTLDAAGKVLTLDTEGPDMTDPTRTAKMKDVIELKGPDQKVLTSHVQGPDGKWVRFMTLTAKRKK